MRPAAWRKKMGQHPRRPLFEAFIRAVIFPDNRDECWLWNGTIGQDGYGKFTGGSLRAHRFSYEMFKGEIPNKMFVCHACDCPRCVNPSHLWLGTSQENTADRNRKGRQARQHRIRPSVTIEQALEMRKLMLCGHTQIKVAKDFGVSQAQAGLIKARKTWHFRDECPTAS